MATTLRDIAQKAGVHPSTVSRILHNNQTVKISDATRKRILAIAKELDYQPNELARAFRLRKTQTIGLIIPDISNSFFSGISRSIEMSSYSSGYNLVVCNTNENVEKELKYVRNLVNRGIDGLIIASCQNDAKHLVDLKDKKIPFVLIDRYFDDLKTNAVISDNKQSAFDAVRMLHELNHKRIAFLRGRPDISTIQSRLQGYLDAVSQFGLEYDPELIAGNSFTVEDGYLATKRLLTLQSPPTAMLTSGNRIIIGALQAIEEFNIQLPKELSLIAYTDDLFTPYLACPLTTISHPLTEMGQKAVDLLLQKINDPCDESTTRIEVKTSFSIRASICKPSTIQ
ncbi:LacI family DNA-binding transcriptional regulator [candidate division KSB1 bacterium]|nr:LacI family DNA-binding transcriptional regulator [candidate division KSB1 bacterium]